MMKFKDEYMICICGHNNTCEYVGPYETYGEARLDALRKLSEDSELELFRIEKTTRKVEQDA